MLCEDGGYKSCRSAQHTSSCRVPRPVLVSSAPQCINDNAMCFRIYMLITLLFSFSYFLSKESLYAGLTIVD